MENKVVHDLDNLGVTCDAELMGSWLDGVHEVPLTSKLLYDLQCVLRYYAEIIAPGKDAVVEYPHENMTPHAKVDQNLAVVPLTDLLNGNVDETIFTVIHELGHIQHSPNSHGWKVLLEHKVSEVLKTIHHDGRTVYDRLFSNDEREYSLRLEPFMAWTMFLVNCVEDARIDALYPVGVTKYQKKSIATVRKNMNPELLTEMKEKDPHAFQVFKDYLMYCGVLDRDEEWQQGFGSSELRDALDKNCAENVLNVPECVRLMYEHYHKLIQDKYRLIYENSEAANNQMSEEMSSFLEKFGVSPEPNQNGQEENQKPSEMKPGDVEATPSGKVEDAPYSSGGHIDLPKSEKEESKSNGIYQDLSSEDKITNLQQLKEEFEGKGDRTNLMLSSSVLAEVQGYEFLTIVDCNEQFGGNSVTYKCGIVDATDVFC